MQITFIFSAIIIIFDLFINGFSFSEKRIIGIVIAITIFYLGTSFELKKHKGP